MNNTKFIAGNSNPELAKNIVDNLGKKLTDCTLDKFLNSELRIEINENVRGSDVFIIQTGCENNEYSVSDHVFELCSLVDACKRSSVKSVTAIIPCYPYARSDKKDKPRVPINGALIAKWLGTSGVDRIICMDLHSGQIQGFTDIPLDNLYAINLLIKKLMESIFRGLSVDERNEKFILVSPDNGALKTVNAYAKKLKMKFVTMHKQRDYSQKSVVSKSLLIGEKEDIEGKIGIIIDDIGDSFGTMVAAANELREKDVKDIIIVITHGFFSGDAFRKINECEVIKKIIVTNTIPQKENLMKSDKLMIVDTSPLFAEVIRRLITRGSLSELFE
jgi:ribose-phosphate pyrophosphokinase